MLDTICSASTNMEHGRAISARRSLLFKMGRKLQRLMILLTKDDMKAIDLLLTLEGHRILNGNEYLTNTTLKGSWSVIDGKLESILYYYSCRNIQSLFGRPDVVLKSVNGNYRFLWKIEV